MIKIKYKILNENENTLDVMVVFKDNTYTVLNLIKDDGTLKNAYILSKNTDRKPYRGTLDDLETWEVE